MPNQPKFLQSTTLASNSFATQLFALPNFLFKRIFSMSFYNKFVLNVKTKSSIGLRSKQSWVCCWNWPIQPITGLCMRLTLRENSWRRVKTFTTWKDRIWLQNVTHRNIWKRFGPGKEIGESDKIWEKVKLLGDIVRVEMNANIFNACMAMCIYSRGKCE